MPIGWMRVHGCVCLLDTHRELHPTSLRRYLGAPDNEWYFESRILWQERYGRVMTCWAELEGAWKSFECDHVMERVRQL
jgi:hypothetical protein